MAWITSSKYFKGIYGVLWLKFWNEFELKCTSCLLY